MNQVSKRVTTRKPIKVEKNDSTCHCYTYKNIDKG